MHSMYLPYHKNELRYKSLYLPFQSMLDHLKEKKDVGFFLSVAGLMQQCSVLDLDGFERCNKAEGLGVSEGGAVVKNFDDCELTCKLFRFLQLLCEGHNLGG